jgi:hypothetical protein
MTYAPRSPRRAFGDIADVAAALREGGGRFSAPRRLVLEALFAADGPVSAEYIADGRGGQVQVGGNGGHGVDRAHVDLGPRAEALGHRIGDGMGVPVHRLVDDECLHGLSIGSGGPRFIGDFPHAGSM